MNYTYAYARRQMEEKFSKDLEIMKRENMKSEEIEIIRNLDIAEMRSDRRYYTHTVYSEDILINGENDERGTSDNYSFSQFPWMDDIENESLQKILKRLSDEELKMIDLIAMQGMSIKEAAKCFNMNYAAFYRKWRNLIDSFLKKSDKS